MKWIEIFTRFGIPKTNTLDQTTMFTGYEFDSYSIGQEEATNKIITKGIAKMLDKNPREWHTLLHYST
ncbi:Chitinase domain-containing protein 1 [Bienertia sinuspersici]